MERTVEAVETVESAGDVERRLEGGRPLLIRGAVRDWPAVARWSAPHLSRTLGHVPLRFKLSVTNKHPDFNQPLSVAFARGEAPLAELVRAITSGPEDERPKRLFTGDERFLLRRRDGVTTLDPELRPLWDDVRVPDFLPEARLFTAWAWLSGAGVRTWLHYDNNGCHNLNAQITGEKECLLFEPATTEPFYFFEPGGPNPAHNCSAVDVDAVDLTRFPRFRDARAFYAELRAGDLLFIPAWWPHAFFHRGEFNTNVNFWWKPDRAVDNAISRRQAGIDAPLPGS